MKDPVYVVFVVVLTLIMFASALKVLVFDIEEQVCLQAFKNHTPQYSIFGGCNIDMGNGIIKVNMNIFNNSTNTRYP